VKRTWPVAPTWAGDVSVPDVTAQRWPVYQPELVLSDVVKVVVQRDGAMVSVLDVASAVDSADTVEAVVMGDASVTAEVPPAAVLRRLVKQISPTKWIVNLVTKAAPEKKKTK
jgi:hypothetical protein